MTRGEGSSERRAGKEPIDPELLYAQQRHFSQQTAADTVTINKIQIINYINIIY